MPKSDRNAINIAGDIKASVERIASREQRSVAQMVRILLAEAIRAREDTQEAALQSVLVYLRSFDTLALLRVGEEVLRLVRMNQEKTVSRCQENMLDNLSFTELVQRHYWVLQQADVCRLAELAQGRLPIKGDVLQVATALKRDYTEILDIARRQFPHAGELFDIRENEEELLKIEVYRSMLK